MGARMLGWVLVLAACVGCDDGAVPGPSEPAPFLEGLPTASLYVSAAGSGFVYALDQRTFRATKLVPGTYPTITPDGRLVTVDGRGLVEWTPGEPGSRVIVPLAIGGPGTPRFDDTFRMPAVSPDGRFVAYDDGLGGLYIVNRSSGDLLASFVGENVFVGFEHATWGAENLLVFSGRSEDAGLYRSSPPWTSHEPISFLYPAPRWPSISTDGTEMLVMHGDDLFRTDIDGRLKGGSATPTFLGYDPFWLTDGAGIGYVRFFDGYVDDVILLTSDGSPALSLLGERPAWLFDTAIGLGPGIGVR